MKRGGENVLGTQLLGHEGRRYIKETERRILWLGYRICGLEREAARQVGMGMGPGEGIYSIAQEQRGKPIGRVLRRRVISLNLH